VNKRKRVFLVSALIVLVILLFWYFRAEKRGAEPPVSAVSSPSAVTTGAKQAGTSSDSAPTNVYAHNLMLRKGPSFRVYVRWLRGQMTRAQRNVNPTFDDPESFFLDIKTGVLRANIGDINNYLNASGLANSPLKNVTLSGDGNQIKLKGTLHKVVPLPVELTGTIAAIPDNLIQIHVTKLNVLKVPFKALLGVFHVTVSDLFQAKNLQGIKVSGNDILFDTQQLLPPPHIRGHLTTVRVVNPDLEEIYGDAQEDVERVEEWRNFLRLRGGTIDFGKLTMHQVDLIMIDISKDPWFDLDLANYQEQLVNGYTRMTPQAGLQIFMPDRREIKPNRNISIEWLKNRNAPPPREVTSK
jgi:hypothetical protein